MIKLYVHTAMNPQCGPGGDNRHSEHLVTEQPLTFGRISRRGGDALCKRHHKFWQLVATPERLPTCYRCIDLLRRLVASGVRVEVDGTEIV